MALVDPVAMNRASAVLARLAVLALAVLGVTGLPLVFLYEPGGWWQWLSTLHGLASMLFLGASAGLLLAALAAAWVRNRTWVGWALALAAFAVAAAGALSGQLIAWESVDEGQLGPAPAARGMFDPVAGDVQSVIVGDTEVDPSAFLRWTLVHVLVLTAAAVVVGRLLWRRLQVWDASPATAGDDGADSGGVDGSGGDAHGSDDESGNQTAEA